MCDYGSQVWRLYIWSRKVDEIDGHLNASDTVTIQKQKNYAQLIYFCEKLLFLVGQHLSRFCNF